MAERHVLVREIMSREIIAVDPDASVAEAVSKMEQHQIHELPVMEKSTLKGWVNYDTLIQRAHVSNQAKVTQIMMQPPRVPQSSDIVVAADMMIRQNIRAAPVTNDKGNVVGVISRTDLLAACADITSIAQQPLEKVMTRELITIDEDATIDEAARRLRETSIRQLLVLNKKGKLLGTVGREVVVHALSGEDKVQQQMTARHGGNRKDRKIDLRSVVEPALIAQPGATIKTAIALMLKQKRTSIVVEQDGFPVGVVSRANVLERLAARAVIDSPLVQVIGLSDHADSAVLDHIHAIARQTLAKVEKEFRVEFLSLHYKLYKAKSEGDSKYSVTAHLSTEQKFIVTKADEWDPLKATNEVLTELERQTFEAKDLRLERRKNPRRGAIFYTATKPN
jgi:CBS domain-containing protein/ribosome-associated translation inhibitor RaiA